MSAPDLSKYEAFLEASKDMPLDQFEKLYSSGNKTPYVKELSFDPEKAKFFQEFMTNHEKGNGKWHPKNYSLSEDQRAAFKKNGFVATTTGKHWGEIYHTLHNYDLPVLITTDSILHAFHMSYDGLLQSVEVGYCMPTLKRILEGMQAELSVAVAKFPTGPFQQNLKDADFFIAVALNLLTAEEHYRPGSAEDPTLKPAAKEKERSYYGPPSPKPQPLVSTILGSDDEVEGVLKKVLEAKLHSCSLLGRKRDIDFSLMQPRGHYTKLAELRQYFRAMSWLGHIDLVVAGEGVPVSELGAAVVLHMLLTANRAVTASFRELNKLIEVLVGPANSMDFDQLDKLLNSAFKLKDHAELNSDEALAQLQKRLVESECGVKKYNGDESMRSFTMLGARFTLDSWASTRFIVEKSQNPRTRISAVDVAFSVLGNEAATQVVLDRIRDTKSENALRDGVEYHPNLVAAKQTIDGLPSEIWEATVYQQWLATLRTLSLPPDERFPQAMRTQAYAMKKMSTQLGSWAQLRHDNMLYVEQGLRFVCACEYPDGYVEPFVEFWKSMERLCLTVAKAVGATNSDDKRYKKWNDDAKKFFSDFAATVHTLLEISETELRQEPLSESQMNFIKNTVELHRYGSGSDANWAGWYPGLFYLEDVEKPDLIACDVFTSYPDVITGEPGCVLHEALGNPRLMYMAIDNGSDIAVYAGPIFNYYEFTLPGQQRKTDEEWAKDIMAGNVPASPEWASYIVA